MVHLVDKDALVARIKRLIRANELYLSKPETDEVRFQKTGAYSVLNDLLHFLDTLEAKEVNLEKELESWRHNHFHGRRDKEASGEYLERTTQLDIAKHFFELGLKAQKGE